ncbi:hypothetical protein [Polyangium fumosum]|uniref:YkgJ family cysteine cluster protein n=1 Tax=Polyangium fumosum TaxID=889272 RepID=A0A4U1IY60_9BACT|nr:hypothetical protein [Polyangium fumosum]TKC99589.1 hypothetical protein E8A74_37455 [Polyangium fumosum]
MIRLELAGVHTLLLSPLCARCPHGRAGCCEAPPAVAWADIGRIVSLGGRDFLLAEIHEGRLVPQTRGLSIRRAPPSGPFPERCGYLGEAGCVLPPDRRSATCNYYLCDEAFAAAENEGDPRVPRGRKMHDRLTTLFGRWDLELAEAIGARYPRGAPWDAEFLDWLGAELTARVRKARM